MIIKVTRYGLGKTEAIVYDEPAGFALCIAFCWPAIVKCAKECPLGKD